MSQRSFVVLSTTAIAASLTLSACGSRGETTGSDAKVVKIGVTAPFTGELSAMGLGIKNSVDLAVKQANDAGGINGFKLELAAVDDQGSAEVGKNAATQLAGDDQVIGVVGNLNSSVAQQSQPVFAAAKIVQVSPANTGPDLTKDPKTGKRPYASYFRTCTTDAVQGPFAAGYLIDQGIKKVATVNDKKAYGQGLVAAFEKAFKAKGGSIVSHQTINPDDTTKDYSSVVTALKPTSPQAVYYGGEYPNAGPLSQQMKSNGLNIPLMGGDGIFDKDFIKLAGSKASGDMATSVGAPVDSTEAGKKFLEQYKAAGYTDGASAYGAYAYDAANAIINGLKTSLKEGSSVKDLRQATIDAVGKVSFEGITGKVAFDAFGDAETKKLTVYTVKDGSWSATKTDTYTE